jgi:hypothetical protein
MSRNPEEPVYNRIEEARTVMGLTGKSWPTKLVSIIKQSDT